jgi:predicted dehydrogenase
VLLTVYQNRRFDADFLTVRAVIDSGELGNVVRFESRMEQYTPLGGLPTSGGGVLLDLGAHVVDQALLLFGPVETVYAEVDDVDGTAGRFFVALRHANGVVSHLVGDMALRGAPALRFRVLGTGASYDAPAFDGQADDLLAGGSPTASPDTWGVVPEDRWGRIHRGATTQPRPSGRGDWTQFYEAFAEALRGNAAVPVDPRDSVAGLVVLEAAQRSVHTRQVVPLPAAPEP